MGVLSGIDLVGSSLLASSNWDHQNVSKRWMLLYLSIMSEENMESGRFEVPLPHMLCTKAFPCVLLVAQSMQSESDYTNSIRKNIASQGSTLCLAGLDEFLICYNCCIDLGTHTINQHKHFFFKKSSSIPSNAVILFI